LGYLISISALLPETLTVAAESTMQNAVLIINKIHSARAMAFVIKGLYYSNTKNKSVQNEALIQHLANNLVQMYRDEADKEWQWFEPYLSYANSILPEAMLYAWLATTEKLYKDIAKSSFDFLLSKIFKDNCIKVVSNKTWLYKGEAAARVVTGVSSPLV